MSSLSINGICRLTRDVEIFKIKNGAFLHFGIATWRKFVKEGKQDVDFFEAEYFLKNIDSDLHKSLTKGKTIYIEKGELRNDKFIGKDGKEKSILKVVIRSFDFIDKAPEKKEVKPRVDEPTINLDDEEEIQF